jgi:hypothetical protein
MNDANLTRSQPLPPWMTQWPALRRVADTSHSLARIGAVVGVLLSAGCAGIERASQPEVSPQAAPMATAVPVEPPAAARVPPTQAKAAATPSKAPAKPAATPSAVAPASKSELPAVALARPQAAAPLDLKSLESRLKETQAIGVFTKLTLKNQIDELLDRFRAYYQGKVKISLAELRRSYDMLVLKVLALLQDADPPLASAIASSREAIWGILSNPAKFAAV